MTDDQEDTMTTHHGLMFWGPSLAALQDIKDAAASADARQEDDMTDQPQTPTTDDVRRDFGTNPDSMFYEPGVDMNVPGGPAFDRWLAAHDAEAHKPLADLAMEGALLIEWVRQVVGGLSDPSREDLNDLFDKCEDYSNKWNSGSKTPLPDPRLPSEDNVKNTLHEHRAGSIFFQSGQQLHACACGITGNETSIKYHVAQAVLAIMPKPTDTEETDR